MAEGSGHRIQVLTAEGKFLRKFGGDKELSDPTSVSIDSDDIVYVCKYYSNVSMFTSEGQFLRSFGTNGK